MGNMHADEAAFAVSEGWASLRQAVTMNLTSNHYPPIPAEYVAPVIEAIRAYSDPEASPNATVDIEVVRQTGMVPRLAFEVDGHLQIRVADLLEITHSWAFVDSDDEQED